MFTTVKSKHQKLKVLKNQFLIQEVASAVMLKKLMSHSLIRPANPLTIVNWVTIVHLSKIEKQLTERLKLIKNSLRLTL
jgi:hypothetical protein